MTIKSLVLTAIGFVMLGLGIVGVAIPVMPTTPFVLVSAVCFGAGNRRFALWLEHSRMFGGFVRNYRYKTGITTQAKAISVSVLWVGLVVSMIMTQKPLVCGILGIVGVCVTAHILLIKTKKQELPADDEEQA